MEVYVWVTNVGEFGGGEFVAEEVNKGFGCCSSEGIGCDLVRRYSIQVKCSLNAIVFVE